MKSNFLKISLLLATFFTLISCDKDFNSLGSDLVDDTHFDLDKYDGATVVAYSKRTGPVQTNNLQVNSLGIYKNSVFGTTTAHFVTQLELVNTNPTIGTNITIDPVKDSVYLYIPYFSHLDEDATDGNTYILDSIYGNKESTLNLKIYRNGYVLRDLSPNPDPTDVSSYNQKYYNNEKGLVESNKVNIQLNDNSNTAENTAFKFSKEQYVKYKTNENGEWLDSNGAVTTDTEKRIVDEEFKPGMWINLNKQYFKENILEAAQSNLINNNNFKEYFRGLYFQIEENSGQDGVLAMLDFSKGKIHIQYHSDITVTTSVGTTTTNDKRELELNLKGNTINFYEYENDAIYQNYQTQLDNANEITGDKQLFLKGGEGSVVYIDLFGTDDTQSVNAEGTALIAGSNDIPDELDELRIKGWLINQANLVFNIDNTEYGMNPLLGGRPSEPKRIYLYDATNNRALIDYTFDSSTASNPKNNKYGFDGIINVDNNEKGTHYTINITNYINSVINSDDKTLNNNIKLGLCVTEDIAISANGFLKNSFTTNNPFSANPLEVKLVPAASILNPLGTVLFGTNIAPGDIDEAKKLKLEIYFTKPN